MDLSIFDSDWMTQNNIDASWANRTLLMTRKNIKKMIPNILLQQIYVRIFEVLRVQNFVLHSLSFYVIYQKEVLCDSFPHWYNQFLFLLK